MSRTVQLHTGNQTLIINASTASFATTASYINPVGLPSGTISSSGQISYTGLSNIPSGIISSSTQLPSGTVSSSGQIDHNTTANYTASRHIDHTAVSITAGSGLSGGGDISTTRTLTLDTSSLHFESGVRKEITGSNTTGAGGITLSYNQTTGNISASLLNSSVTVNGQSISLGGSGTITANTTNTLTLGNGLTGTSFNGGTTVTTTVDTGSTHFTNGVKTKLNTDSVISSSGQVSYLGLSNIPSSILSSSTQINNLSGVSSSFAATASYVNILNQTVSASGNIEAGTNLRSNFSSGDEGGEINLARPQTNTSISGSVVIDVNGNRVRIFEANSPNRGGYFDITSLTSGVGTNLVGGGTVTSITAGNGLTGGTITGTGTITIDTASVHFTNGVKAKLNTDGVISSSGQVSYVGLSNIPSGIVSSSTQQVVSTYTNATDNRVLTSTGAGGINGESALTFDGAVLAVTTNNAKYFQGGDDAALWDVNVANTIGVYGVQDSTVGAIKLGSSGQTIYSNATGVGIGTTAPGAVLHVQGNVSASSYTGSLLSTNGIVSSSGQISYTGLSSIPTGIVSGAAQVTALLPTGTVSSSTQINNYNIFTTTGSNTFTANQTISGSITITQNLNVLGSSSINYVSQSTLNIGTNLVTVNVQNPSIRFGGLAVIDSGSSPQRSGSLLFDSTNDQWIFVHQNQTSPTSSVLLMGPQTFNNIGNETNLTNNYLLKSTNAEHVGDSQLFDNGTNVGIGTASPGTKLHIQGNVSASSYTGSLLATNGIVSSSGQVSYTGLSSIPTGILSSSTQFNALTSTSASFATTANNLNGGTTNYIPLWSSATVQSSSTVFQSVGNIGIGTVSPKTRLDVNSGWLNTVAPSSAGTANSASVYFTNLDPNYGILMGVLGTGTGWIQVQRTDVTATTYPLLLNPNGGNVGIGTTSPGVLLDVSGTTPTARIIGTSGTTPKLTLSSAGVSAWSFRTSGSDSSFRLDQDGTDRITVLSGGNVGVGTSAPQYKLHVSGGLSLFNSNTAGSDGNSGIRIVSPIATTHYNWMLGAQQNVNSAFEITPSTTVGGTTFSTPTAVFTATGNVGVGTTSPQNLLHVQGSNSFVRISNPSTGDGGLKISYQNSDTHGLHLSYNPNNALSYIDNTYPTSSGQVYGDIYFRQNIDGTMTSRMMIQARSGNVGINVTPNNSKLEVVATSGEIFRADAASGAYRIVANQTGVMMNGNVGIGTTSPVTKLDVRGSIGSSFSTATYATFDSSTDGNLYITANAGAANISVSTIFRSSTAGSAVTERMRIDSSGNVGIGTTSPRTRLDISGITSIQSIFETTTTSATAANGTVNFDVSSQAILYYTSNAAGNWTLNIRGNSTTTLDSILATGQNNTLVFMVTNGSPAYYQTGFQIDGTSTTIKWLEGTAPTSGNINSIDVYTFSILKTATNTYTVLGSRSKFA